MDQIYLKTFLQVVLCTVLFHGTVLSKDKVVCYFCKATVNPNNCSSSTQACRGYCTTEISHYQNGTNIYAKGCNHFCTPKNRTTSYGSLQINCCFGNLCNTEGMTPPQTLTSTSNKWAIIGISIAMLIVIICVGFWVAWLYSTEGCCKRKTTTTSERPGQDDRSSHANMFFELYDMPPISAPPYSVENLDPPPAYDESMAVASAPPVERQSRDTEETLYEELSADRTLAPQQVPEVLGYI